MRRRPGGFAGPIESDREEKGTFVLIELKVQWQQKYL
jgi:hypothetical protein